MNGWHLAVALGFCLSIGACSRRDALFSNSPVFKAQTSLSASVVADCVEQRWRQGTRSLQRDETGKAITMHAESIFSGARMGLKVLPDGEHSRVEYFERRRTDPLYWSMVRSCLRPDAGSDASAPPDAPRS